MTDAEIIKALECCTNSLDCPADCPLYEYAGDCFLALHKPTLDLLNRQKAEIERLKNNCFCIANERDAINDCLNTAVEEAKAETIKEFAERLKETFPQDDFLRSTKRITEDIDNLVEEMVGDTE